MRFSKFKRVFEGGGQWSEGTGWELRYLNALRLSERSQDWETCFVLSQHGDRYELHYRKRK